MRITIDNELLRSVREFGRRTPRANEPRFYYYVIGYSCIILVSHGKPLDELIDGKRTPPLVLLKNYDQVDPQIVVQQFPHAPQTWGEMEQGELTQFSVKVDRQRRLDRQRSTALMDAIRDEFGRGC